MSDEILSSIYWKKEKSNKGGGVAEVCSSQTGLRFGTLLRDMYARIRTYYVRPNIIGENKKHPPEVRSRDGHTCRTFVQKFRSISCKTSWTYRFFCGKHAYFQVVDCNYLALLIVQDGVLAYGRIYLAKIKSTPRRWRSFVTTEIIILILSFQDEESARTEGVVDVDEQKQRCSR